MKKEIETIDAKIARIDERTANLVTDVSEIKHKIESHYVTQEEFKPVKSIVYGLVGLILTTVIMALLYLIIRT